MNRSLPLLLLVVTGCGGPGVAALGDGKHDASQLIVETLATADEMLTMPRDVDINPNRPDELWVSNTGDQSMTILFDWEGGGDFRNDLEPIGGPHFFALPSAIDFGVDGMFASIHETDDRTQGDGPGSTPGDFMGPTLWIDDLDIFDAGHPGHMDMLHNSPNGMGIAHHEGNAYWVFDGYHASITRYDFADDHGPGGADHSDGVVHRYAEGEVEWVEGVPSNMWWDAETELLYINDTGNQRIGVMDPSTGEEGSRITPNYDGSIQEYMDGVEVDTLVLGAALVNTKGKQLDFGLEAPSGMAPFTHPEHGKLLFVTDNASSRLLAFNLQGQVVDHVQLSNEAGSLMGLDVADDGTIVLVDALNDEVFAIFPE